MPYDLFWHGDPNAARMFRRAHELHIEQRNQEMWLQGLYIYNAVGVAIANAFAGKGSKKQTYLEQPIEILPKREAQKKIEAEEARQKIIDHFSSLKKAWDKNQGGNTNDDRKP